MRIECTPRDRRAFRRSASRSEGIHAAILRLHSVLPVLRTDLKFEIGAPISGSLKLDVRDLNLQTEG